VHNWGGQNVHKSRLECGVGWGTSPTPWDPETPEACALCRQCMVLHASWLAGGVGEEVVVGGVVPWASLGWWCAKRWQHMFSGRLRAPRLCCPHPPSASPRAQARCVHACTCTYALCVCVCVRVYVCVCFLPRTHPRPLTQNASPGFTGLSVAFAHPGSSWPSTRSFGTTRHPPPQSWRSAWMATCAGEEGVVALGRPCHAPVKKPFQALSLPLAPRA
jgi:hypothetical protein